MRASAKGGAFQNEEKEGRARPHAHGSLSVWVWVMPLRLTTFSHPVSTTTHTHTYIHTHAQSLSLSLRLPLWKPNEYGEVALSSRRDPRDLSMHASPREAYLKWPCCSCVLVSPPFGVIATMAAAGHALRDPSRRTRQVRPRAQARSLALKRLHMKEVGGAPSRCGAGRRLYHHQHRHRVNDEGETTAAVN